MAITPVHGGTRPHIYDCMCWLLAMRGHLLLSVSNDGSFFLGGSTKMVLSTAPLKMKRQLGRHLLIWQAETNKSLPCTHPHKDWKPHVCQFLCSLSLSPSLSLSLSPSLPLSLSPSLSLSLSGSLSHFCYGGLTHFHYVFITFHPKPNSPVGHTFNREINDEDASPRISLPLATQHLCTLCSNPWQACLQCWLRKKITRHAASHLHPNDGFKRFHSQATT